MISKHEQSTTIVMITTSDTESIRRRPARLAGDQRGDRDQRAEDQPALAPGAAVAPEPTAVSGENL